VVDDVGITDAVDDERLYTMNAVEEGTLEESAGPREQQPKSGVSCPVFDSFAFVRLHRRWATSHNAVIVATEAEFPCRLNDLW
jgi:hypothetical protein